MDIQTPKGFSSFVTCAHIKDDSEDLTVVHSEVVCKAAALFTKNKVKGNPVLVGKKHIANGKIQTIVVNSKNANVATGKKGYQDVLDICQEVASQLHISVKNVLPSSTGIIGRRLPKEKIINSLQGLKQKFISPADFSHVAKAIMTTDTFAKAVSVRFDGVTISAIAKGSGMIEPNMATLLSYFFTDAQIDLPSLRKIFKRVINKTYNSLSIDSDMSTSDTALILSNGLAGKIDKKKFEKELEKLATKLVRMLARDGEGATKLFIVDVVGANSKKDAKRIGKSVINSPLVKTAIYKGDPNWGRIYMAVGKTKKIKTNIKKMKIYWGNPPLFYSDNELEKLHEYLSRNEEIYLTIDLQQGKKSWRVYGCDLTEQYVHINAYYST